MYANNYNNYYYQQNPNGFNAAAKSNVKITQPVTMELSKVLQKEDNMMDMRISKPDSIKNMCTHKNPSTGEAALVDNHDGTFTCKICGETFHLIQDPVNQIEDATNMMIDILQTIKFLYISAPEDMVKNYFQIISLLKKAPYLFRKGNESFNNAEAFGTGGPIPNGMQPNVFATVNGMINGINPFQGGFMQPQPYGQPYMNYGYQATPPMAPQQYAPNQYPNQYAPGQYQQPGQMGYVPTNPQATPNPMAPAGGNTYDPAAMQGTFVPSWANAANAAYDNGNPMAYGAPQAPVQNVQSPAPIQAPQQQQQAAAPVANEVPAPTGTSQEITQNKTFTV